MSLELLTAGLSSLAHIALVPKSTLVASSTNVVTKEIELINLYKGSLMGTSLAEHSNANTSHKFEEGITLHIKTLTGRTISIEVSPKRSVEELKQMFAQVDGTPVDQQRFIFDHKQLEDGRSLADYGITDESTVHLVLRLRGGGSPPTYVLDDSLLDKRFDFDFTDLHDTEQFQRGGERYVRPCGWYRYAINVLKKYDGGQAVWLGPKGHRTQSAEGEWPVSYHGTGLHEGRNIAQEGYQLSKCKRFLFGYGVYSTPYPNVAAAYAKKFTHANEHYEIMMQNRVKPEAILKVDASQNGVGEYWICPETDIRPYGVLIRKV